MTTLKILILAALVLMGVTEMPTPEGLTEFPGHTSSLKA
jgi:hypothetical protein